MDVFEFRLRTHVNFAHCAALLGLAESFGDDSPIRVSFPTRIKVSTRHRDLQLLYRDFRTQANNPHIAHWQMPLSASRNFQSSCAPTPTRGSHPRYHRLPENRRSLVRRGGGPLRSIKANTTDNGMLDDASAAMLLLNLSGGNGGFLHSLSAGFRVRADDHQLVLAWKVLMPPQHVAVATPDTGAKWRPLKPSSDT